MPGQRTSQSDSTQSAIGASAVIATATASREEEREQLDERVVHIARTAKVLKGGRRFAFRAVVVVGDNHGQVGFGVGKAREVPDAVRKASERARAHHAAAFPMVGTTIPHSVIGDFSAARVLLRPASARHRRHRRRRRACRAGSGGHPRHPDQVAGQRQHAERGGGDLQGAGIAEETLRKRRSDAGKPVEAVTPYWLRGGKDGSDDEQA